MNPIAKICLYLGIVLAVSAMLAPPIFWLAQSQAVQGIVPGLQAFPFHRFFSRIVQIVALLLLWPAVRFLDIRSLDQIGIRSNPRKWQDVAAGFLVALVPLVLFSALALSTGTFSVRKEIDWAKIIRITGTALGVAAFEEFLFRGVLLGLAVRSVGFRAGLPLVSALFALIHFVKPAIELPPDRITWMSGFQLVAAAFSGAPPLTLTLWGGVSLFSIGMIMGWAKERTASLFLPIGLHAGWIFGQQTFGMLARFRGKPPDFFLPWAGPNVVSGMVPTGIAALVALLVSALLMWWYLARAHPRTPISPSPTWRGAQ